MIDFNKPVALYDKRTGENNKYRIRVIATDRICPVKFHYVLLAYNPHAMFGPEEFVITAREDGTVSGRGFESYVLKNTD